MTEKSFKKGGKIFTIIINKSRPIIIFNITSMLVVAELEAIWEMAEVIKQSRRRISEGGRLERLERTEPT